MARTKKTLADLGEVIEASPLPIPAPAPELVSQPTTEPETEKKEWTLPGKDPAPDPVKDREALEAYVRLQARIARSADDGYMNIAHSFARSCNAFLVSPDDAKALYDLWLASRTGSRFGDDSKLLKESTVKTNVSKLKAWGDVGMLPKQVGLDCIARFSPRVAKGSGAFTNMYKVLRAQKAKGATLLTDEEFNKLFPAPDKPTVLSSLARMLSSMDRHINGKENSEDYPGWGDPTGEIREACRLLAGLHDRLSTEAKVAETALMAAQAIEAKQALDDEQKLRQSEIEAANLRYLLAKYGEAKLSEMGKLDNPTDIVHVKDYSSAQIN